MIGLSVIKSETPVMETGVDATDLSDLYVILTPSV